MGDEEANAEDEDTARQLQLKLQALKTERKTLRDMRKLVQRELSRLEVDWSKAKKFAVLPRQP